MREWKLAIGIVTLVAVAVAVAFVGVATSTTPGRNSLIVYAPELSPGRFQLFTIHPDGTGTEGAT
jgi:autotransporter translocation and assembly factor TamB